MEEVTRRYGVDCRDMEQTVGSLRSRYLVSMRRYSIGNGGGSGVCAIRQLV